MNSSATARHMCWWRVLVLILALFGMGQTIAQPELASPQHTYPPELAEALLKRKLAEEQAIAATPLSAAFAFVSKNFLWPSGQRLIVAFYGGHYEMWRDIAEIANQWSNVANITFDFGLDPKKRTARMWNPADQMTSAIHVRVRLDMDSAQIRYSAVGREAWNQEFIAGSLVLGGLRFSYPMWTAEDKADILHEFGHVLGFVHEQQRPECSKDWRLEPGPGGEPSVFQVYEKVFNWRPEKTRTNLLLAEKYQGEAMGPPDKLSLFMYPTLPALLPATFSGGKGPCHIARKNFQLSKDDIKRARNDYPFHTDNGITRLAAENLETLKQYTISSGLSASPLLQRLQNVEKALRPLVYVQVPSEAQRETGNSLLRSLQGEGFIAPAVENIGGKAMAPKDTEIRYFSNNDAAQARAVADLVQRELGPDTPVTTRLVKRSTERKLPVEVWLSR